MSDMTASQAIETTLGGLADDQELYFVVTKKGGITAQGSYNCSRCHGNGDQPDTVKHRPGCDYK